MEGNRVHAFGPDLLADHDAVALADLVRRRAVSPVELVRAAIDRVEQVNGRLNAVSCGDYERALSEAAKPRAGLLTGVPTFVKDNIDLHGLPTRHGSQALPPDPAARDESFTQQYSSLGMCVLGKTTMPEFGLNGTTEYQGRPATRNPWHTSHSSGGSSGGSAALVAAGAVPIAHANDGAGSIRIPAAWCGLVGLKPSRGRLVQADLARSLPVKIVVEGVLTRSVRDTAHFFAGSEQYWRNPKLPPIGLVEGPGRRQLTIGIITDSVVGVPTSPEICRVIEQTGEMLAGLGHRVEATRLNVPRAFAEDFADYWTFIAFCRKSIRPPSFRQTVRRGQAREPDERTGPPFPASLLAFTADALASSADRAAAHRPAPRARSAVVAGDELYRSRARLSEPRPTVRRVVSTNAKLRRIHAVQQCKWHPGYCAADGHSGQRLAYRCPTVSPLRPGSFVTGDCLYVRGGQSLEANYVQERGVARWMRLLASPNQSPKMYYSPIQPAWPSRWRSLSSSLANGRTSRSLRPGFSAG